VLEGSIQFFILSKTLFDIFFTSADDKYFHIYNITYCLHYLLSFFVLNFLKVHFIYFPGILFPGFTLMSFHFTLYLSRISILLGHDFVSFISLTVFPSFQILLFSMFSFHPLSWLDSYVLEFLFCLACMSSNI
jgi:hypothetical protein